MYLNSLIITKYSIKEDFYQIKNINDILFNHELLSNKDDDEQDEINKAYGKNILKFMGKMLTAVFKDYLIYDDIYEFLEPAIYSIS